MKHLHTPGDPRVFVFGSNQLGIHGKGAALYAAKFCGALKGLGEGPQPKASPRCYAIPTCKRPGEPLELDKIWWHVRRFMEYARGADDGVRFFVSAIGTGLAGYTAQDIAPLFREAPDSCDLPPGWRLETVRL